MNPLKLYETVSRKLNGGSCVFTICAMALFGEELGWCDLGCIMGVLGLGRIAYFQMLEKPALLADEILDLHGDAFLVLNAEGDTWKSKGRGREFPITIPYPTQRPPNKMCPRIRA